jgi:hypothetical protein
LGKIGDTANDTVKLDEIDNAANDTDKLDDIDDTGNDNADNIKVDTDSGTTNLNTNATLDTTQEYVDFSEVLIAGGGRESEQFEKLNSTLAAVLERLERLENSRQRDDTTFKAIKKVLEHTKTDHLREQIESIINKSTTKGKGHGNKASDRAANDSHHNNQGIGQGRGGRNNGGKGKGNNWKGNVQPKVVTAPFGLQKVHSLGTLKTSKSSDAVLVQCKDAEEEENVANWCSSVGRTNVTVVTFAGDGDKTVAVKDSKGRSTSVTAKVRQLGSDAPTAAALPPGMKDDSSTEDTNTAPLAAVRLTIAKQWANQAAYARAKTYPHTAPKIVLPQHLTSKIVQTRGAVPYESEVTCILKVNQANVNDFLQYDAPAGIFLTLNGTSSVPQWLPQGDKTEATYFMESKTAAVAAKGRLIYRRHNKAPLGILGGTHVSQALPDRWQASRLPRTWLETNVQEWVTQRGFTNIDDVTRQTGDSWSFTAKAPFDTGTATNTTFTLANGRTIALFSKVSGKKPKPTQPARMAWGAASPSDDSKGQGTARSTGKGTNANHPTTAANGKADQPMAGEDSATARPNGAAQRSRSRSPRGNEASSSTRPPWATTHDTIECGGAGDCAYCVIGWSFNEQMPPPDRKKTAGNPDYAPKGKIQANLRLLAMEELTKKKEDYAAFTAHDIETEANNCKSAGNYCNGLHLQALARATNAAILVWTWEDKLSQWRHYTVLPRKLTNKTKYVYMVLKDAHCQLLRPKLGVDIATVKAATDKWAEQSITLQPKDSTIIYIGGGGADADVLRDLGIDNSTDSSDEDKAGPGSASKSVCRQLGISKRSQRTTSSKQHQQKCPSKVQSSVCRQLGISRRGSNTSNATANDLPTDDLPDTKADKRYTTFKCPKCPWMPADTIKPTSARHEAKKHWLACVGHLWDKADGATRLRNVDIGARRQALFDKAIDHNRNTIANLPKGITKHLCKLNLDVPFANGNGRTYACSQCGKCLAPSKVFRQICGASKLPTGTGARTKMRDRAVAAVQKLNAKAKPTPDVNRDTELTKVHLATRRAMVQYDVSITRFMCTIKAGDYKKRCDTTFANDAARTKTQHVRLYRCQRCQAYRTFSEIKKEPCTQRPSTCSYNDCQARLAKARQHIVILGMTKPVLGKRKAAGE